MSKLKLLPTPRIFWRSRVNLVFDQPKNNHLKIEGDVMSLLFYDYFCGLFWFFCRGRSRKARISRCWSWIVLRTGASWRRPSRRGLSLSIVIRYSASSAARTTSFGGLLIIDTFRRTVATATTTRTTAVIIGWTVDRIIVITTKIGDREISNASALDRLGFKRRFTPF